MTSGHLQDAQHPHTIRLNLPVFISSALVLLRLVLATLLSPGSSEQWLEQALLWVSKMFGWYYLLLVGGVLVFVIWLALSRFGSLKLGSDDQPADFGYLSWSTMLFSAGIGIALVYYGTYEPLEHFLQPPEGKGGTIEAARRAMVLTFFHWGVHGWALYALIATVIAWFAYRRGQPLALRSALSSLIGRRIDGWAGHIIDSFGILVTIIAMVLHLGMGAELINSGLNYLFGVPESLSVKIILIIIMMSVVTLAVVAGVKKGIALISNINVIALSLLLLILFAGQTLHLVDGLLQNIGDYLNNIVGQSFNLYLYGKAQQWQSSWTLFFWAWWLVWSPFIGLFIARISRGRTVRALIFGTMLIPLGFTFVWLSLFGNTAITIVLDYKDTLLGQVALSDPAMSVYKMLESLPWRGFTAGFTLVVTFLLFITPIDSSTLMVANLSSAGGAVTDDAPMWLRVFWSVIITLVCGGLLYSGDFDTIRTVVVLFGLPFSGVVILYIVAFYRELRKTEILKQEQGGVKLHNTDSIHQDVTNKL